MLFGELVPQTLALARPLAVARAIVPLQRGLARICRPIISSAYSAAGVTADRELVRRTRPEHARAGRWSLAPRSPAGMGWCVVGDGLARFPQALQVTR